MKNQINNRKRIIIKLVFKIIVRFLTYKFYKKILPKSTKNKYLETLHRRTANQIGETMFLLGGVVIKVGQLLSTMSSLLPEVYVNVLEKTQNNLESKPFIEIKKSIENELKIPVNKVFSSIEQKALGVATIGQVHKATLLNGVVVAVKIQHSNIDKLARMDLQILRKVMTIVKYFIKLEGFKNIFSEIEKLILDELNYKKEALSLTEFKNNFKNDVRVKVPKVYNEFSTSKLLVLEYIEGEKITKTVGDNKKQLAEKMVDVFCTSVFKYGMYHADPHPGNVLINNKNQLVFLDFGAVGHFNTLMKEGVIILFEALFLKDENLMIAAFTKLNFIKKNKKTIAIFKKIFKNIIEELEQEFGETNLEFQKINLNKIDLLKVVSVIKKINKKELEEIVNIPKEWMVLYRAIILTMGVSKSLSSNVDVYKIVKDNVMLMMLKNKKLVFKNTIEQQINRLIKLPRKLENFIDTIDENYLFLNKGTCCNRGIGKEIILKQILYIISAAISYHFYLVTNYLLFMCFLGISLLLLGIITLKKYKLKTI